MLHGSIVALVTPMDSNGQIDFQSLKKLIHNHINYNTSAIVIAGSTGESSTLSIEEHIQLIQTSIEYANGRIPIIAGIGGNSTREVIEIGKLAKDERVYAYLSVVPYYNKPTQEGIYQHFEAIADEVEVPQIIYNIPSRSVVDMSNQTILRLSEIPSIIGLKDATSDLNRASELFALIPQEFGFYSGDDATALAYMLLGGHGCISVCANLVPVLFNQLCQAALNGDLELARKINQKLIRLYVGLNLETNPIPVKFFMEQMNTSSGGLRLPLTRLNEKYHAVVNQIIADLNENTD